MIGNQRIRLAVALIAVLAPAGLRRQLLVHLLGYRIAADAKVGRSIITVDKLVMGPGSSIGSLNLFRHVARVELGANASIGHLNWISSANSVRGFFAGIDRDSALVMADRSAITHQHYIDCCDRVTIGELSVVAGLRSQILTHGVDVEAGALMAAPVTIEDRALVCSGVILIAGAVVPSRVVVGAGAVVKGVLPEECALYTGPTAVIRRPLPSAGGFFVRREARVY